jgi:hypothetical protein
MLLFPTLAQKPWARLPAAALLLTLASPQVFGDASLVYYRSPIDNTDQAYGVYVPNAARPATGYPCILHAHGYGWWVGPDFSDWQKQWADEHAFVLINLNARGPLFYEGLGEAATQEVVTDSVARFGLDRSRLFMTGASMGGTGAYRQGIRHPDVFAAIAGVDGWTDWHEWYSHWYARWDMKDDIDEFRRPLLSSAAPLFWAEQSMWGRIRQYADALDTTVFPGQEMLLNQRLFDLQQQNPGAYHADLVLNRGAGHGGSYDLGAIYDFFLHSAPAGMGPRVRIAAWRLLYAQQGWLRLAQIRYFGRLATAESVIRDGRLSVWTDNVSAIDVTPADVPELVGAERCEVWIDGQLIYSGKPTPIHATSTSDSSSALLWWRRDEDSPSAPPAIYEKRPGLEGPIGDCFNQPFLAVYATHGPADDVARHRREAESFCNVWNDYFVHAPGISPVPEDAVTDADMAARNLVMFGCQDCSRLLTLAARSHPFPIDVHHSSVTVRDASGASRTFSGANFGTFFIYPNPLSGGTRYLVVQNGQWKMIADTEELAGLEYDLEKMPFAYPDYVVFNSDRHQLPFILNYSNKRNTKAYDPAYMVDVGYFDNQWRLSRDVVTRWVKALKPDRAKLVHAGDMTRSPDAVGVRIVDDGGAAIEKARVTISPSGASITAVSGSDGWARFTGLTGGDTARLTGVMATACSYDRTADCLAASDAAASTSGLLAAAYSGPDSIDAVLTSARGTPFPADPVRLTLLPGADQTVEWQLRDDANFADAAGILPLRLTLTAHPPAGSVTVCVPALVEVCGEAPTDLVLADLKSKRDDKGVWQITVVATNTSSAPLDLTLRGMIPQANCPLAPQPTHLDANASATVTWTLRPADVSTWVGPARLVVYADGMPPAAARAEIVLPPPGGIDLASTR